MIFDIRNIVCAIDFSPASIEALDVSIMLAREHGASVHAVHAYSAPPVPFVQSGIMTLDEGRLLSMLDGELRELIAARADASVPIERVVRAGWPAAAILIEADRVHADVAVTGTRGLTGLPRFMLGSVAERLVRTSPVPVLAVPEPLEPARTWRIRTILCGIDFSNEAATALRVAASLATKHRAALHVVHVWEPPRFLKRHTEVTAEHQRELRCELAAEAKRAEQGAMSIASVVRRGAPYAGIVDEAREIGADLIVTGSTGESGSSHFLLGGVAERVLRVSPVPVLVTRH